MVVSAPQVPEAMTSIEEICQERQASLVVVDDHPDWRWEIGRVTFKGQAFYMNGHNYWLPLLGAHQITNAVTAMATVHALSERTGLTVPQGAIAEGISTVKWPGRLEILGRDPYVVIDSAMNGDSARNLRQAMQDYFPGRDVILVIGATADHEYTALLKNLLPVGRKIIMTQSRHPRAATPQMLAEAAAGLGFDTIIEPTVEQALQLALDNARPRDVVCITGSLFCVASAREIWMRNNDLPLPPIDPENYMK
jgi:dihydrofolate synthase/folylpolyglutamate synthase